MKSIRLQRLSLLFIVLFSTALSAQPFTESSGGQAIIGSGSNNTTYYAPAFAYGETGCNKYDLSGNYITGQCVYLYVQGDDSLSSTTYTDQILMFWNPNTWTGLTSQYAGPDRLLPSQDYLGNAHTTSHFFGQPSVLVYNGTYYMTAHESPDAVEFHKQWWGVSADGKSWTWYPLFTYTGSGNLKIPGVTLQPRTVNGTLYFYGATEIWSNAGIGLGAIRLRVNTSNARGYDLVEMYSSGAWTTVADSSNQDGNFNFIPDKLLDGGTNPKLLENNELWMTVNNRTRDCTNCHSFSGTAGAWGDRFAVRTFSVSSTLSAPPSFGSESLLQSSVRCMPSNYDNGRLYPMPLATG